MGSLFSKEKLPATEAPKAAEKAALFGPLQAGQVWIEGPTKYTTGKMGEFLVNTSNAGAGILIIQIDGPSKVTLDTFEVDTGYKARFSALAPGAYFVAVKYNGIHILGSPLRIHIDGKVLGGNGYSESVAVKIHAVAKASKGRVAEASVDKGEATKDRLPDTMTSAAAQEELASTVHKKAEDPEEKAKKFKQLIEKRALLKLRLAAANKELHFVCRQEQKITGIRPKEMGPSRAERLAAKKALKKKKSAALTRMYEVIAPLAEKMKNNLYGGASALTTVGIAMVPRQPDGAIAHPRSAMKRSPTTSAEAAAPKKSRVSDPFCPRVNYAH